MSNISAYVVGVIALALIIRNADSINGIIKAISAGSLALTQSILGK